MWKYFVKYLQWREDRERQIESLVWGKVLNILTLLMFKCMISGWWSASNFEKFSSSSHCQSMLHVVITMYNVLVMTLWCSTMDYKHNLKPHSSPVLLSSSGEQTVYLENYFFWRHQACYSSSSLLPQLRCSCSAVCLLVCKFIQRKKKTVRFLVCVHMVGH